MELLAILGLASLGALLIGDSHEDEVVEEDHAESAAHGMEEGPLDWPFYNDGLDQMSALASEDGEAEAEGDLFDIAGYDHLLHDLNGGAMIGAVEAQDDAADDIFEGQSEFAYAETEAESDAESDTETGPETAEIVGDAMEPLVLGFGDQVFTADPADTEETPDASDETTDVVENYDIEDEKLLVSVSPDYAGAGEITVSEDSHEPGSALVTLDGEVVASVPGGWPGLSADDIELVEFDAA